MSLGERPPGALTRRSGRVRGWLARARSDDSLSKKASLNWFASVLDYGARIVVGLSSIPLLVSRLGDVAFGVWQSLLRLIGQATSGERTAEPGTQVDRRPRPGIDRYDEKRLRVGMRLAVWVLFLPIVAGLAGGVLAWFSPMLDAARRRLYPTVLISRPRLLVVEPRRHRASPSFPQSVVQGENLGYKRVGLSMSLVLIGGGLRVARRCSARGSSGSRRRRWRRRCLPAPSRCGSRARTSIGSASRARAAQRSARSVRLSGWFLLWNLVMQLMRASDIVVLGIAGVGELVTSLLAGELRPRGDHDGWRHPHLLGHAGARWAGGSRRPSASGRRPTESMAVTWLLATVAGAASSSGRSPS